MQRIGTFCSAGQDASGKAIVKRRRLDRLYGQPLWRLGLGLHARPGQLFAGRLRPQAPRHGPGLPVREQRGHRPLHGPVQRQLLQERLARAQRQRRHVRPVGLAGLLAADHGLHRPGPGLAGLHLRRGRHADLGHPDPADRRLGRQHGRTTSTRGSAVPGLPFVNYCGAGSACATQREGLYIENQARNFDHSEGTKDFSATCSGTSATSCTPASTSSTSRPTPTTTTSWSPTAPWPTPSTR
jgi:hypothetical protein